MCAMKRIPAEYGAGKKKSADGAAGKGRAGKGRDYTGKPSGKSDRSPEKDKPGSFAPSDPGKFRGKRPYEKKEDSFRTPSYKPKGDSDDRPARPWKKDTEHSAARSSGAGDSRNSDNRPWNKSRSSDQKDESGDKLRSRGTGTSDRSKFSGGTEDGARPYRKRIEKDERPDRSSGNERQSGDRADDKGESSYKRTRAPYKKDEAGDKPRTFGAKRYDNPGHVSKNEEGDRPERRKYSESTDSDRKPYKRRESGSTGSERRLSGDRDKFKPGSPAGENRYKGRKTGGITGSKTGSDFQPKLKKTFKDDGTIRLNKYIANSGVCSRREADTLIESGAVSVNGKVVTELGTKITRDDKVQFGGETLSVEKKVYLLLNKPKGYITTVDDPQERNTVMMLVKDACRERIYPVGRLDRNTSGLLLFTNDGDMAVKLTHPGHKVRKVYHVELDKALSKSDMMRLSEGVELEDGLMAVDEIAYTGAENNKKNIGVVVHSGKNRVVRRLFEELEYAVVKLDRVAFANLTKKDLPRGRWRMLDEKEINLLQMI